MNEANKWPFFPWGTAMVSGSAEENRVNGTLLTVHLPQNAGWIKKFSFPSHLLKLFPIRLIYILNILLLVTIFHEVPTFLFFVQFQRSWTCVWGVQEMSILFQRCFWSELWVLDFRPFKLEHVSGDLLVCSSWTAEAWGCSLTCRPSTPSLCPRCRS